MEGARFGVRLGIDPETTADLVALLPQFGKVESVEAAAGQMGAIAHALNEGRGDLGPLMKSLIEVAGPLVAEEGGEIATLPELAALVGVESAGANPKKSGTHIKQAARALSKFAVDGEGKPKGMQAKALDEIGIKPGMRFMEKYAKIAPLLMQADKDGTGAPAKLFQMGFHRSEDIESLTFLARNNQVAQTRTADALKLTDQGGKVIQQNADFQTKEKAGVHRRAVAEAEAQDTITGLNQEMLNEARNAGHRMLRNEGKVSGPENTWRQSFSDLGPVLPKMGFKRQSQVDDESRFMENLALEMRKAGIDPREELARSADRQTKATGRPAAVDGTAIRKRLRPDQVEQQLRMSFDRENGKFVRDMITRVMARGLNPFGTGEVTKKRLEQAGKHDEEVRTQDAGRIAPPDPNKPPRPVKVGMGGGAFRGIPLGLLAASAVGAVDARNEGAPILRDGEFPGNDGMIKTTTRPTANRNALRDAVRDAHIARTEAQSKARREKTQAAIEAASKDQDARKAVRVNRTMGNVARAVEEQDAKREERIKTTEAGMKPAESRSGKEAGMKPAESRSGKDDALMKELIALQRENNDILKTASRARGPLAPGAGPIFPGRK